MSSNPKPPGHFGAPISLTEVRLFGRWVLWQRYTWVRREPLELGEPIDLSKEQEEERLSLEMERQRLDLMKRQVEANEAVASHLGIKRVVSVPDEVKP